MIECGDRMERGDLETKDGEMERWRDGEMERWGDEEMERWGDGFSETQFCGVKRTKS